MIDEIPHLQPKLSKSLHELEWQPKRRKRSLSASLACYGGGESKSENESNSTTTTTTTSNVQDNRQGVSEEGILAEEGSTVQVDRSTTTIVEDVSEEIAIEAIQTSGDVAERGLDAAETLSESAFDTSEELFREATGVTSAALASNERLSTELLNKSENLIKDRSSSEGAKIGQTAILGAFGLGIVFLLFNRRSN